MNNNTLLTDCITQAPWIIKKSECNQNCIESIFPVIYHTEKNKFEILPGLDLSRKKEVWGYEVAPGIIMEKNNYNCDWEQMKFLCRKFKMENKEGKLLSIEKIVSVFDRNLYAKICKMTNFLQQNGIASSASGTIYSRSEINGMYVWVYEFSSNFKFSCYIKENHQKRLVITF